MDNNNNSTLRLYDEIIYVNAKDQHSHSLKACEGGKGEGGGEEEEKGRKRRGRNFGVSPRFKSLLNRLLGCVTSGKFLNLSDSPFSPL